MVWSQTAARWRALEPGARRRLVLYLLRLAAIMVVLYAVVAIVDHSWWRPAVWIVVGAIVTAAVGQARTLFRARSK